MSRLRILSVGQCGYDHGQISRQLGRGIGADVVPAGTHADAITILQSAEFHLVLVNRIGDEDGAPGLDLIRVLKADPATASIPLMLVSNYPESQAQAVELGALPGFGKSELGRSMLPAALVSAVRAFLEA